MGAAEMRDRRRPDGGGPEQCGDRAGNAENGDAESGENSAWGLRPRLCSGRGRRAPEPRHPRQALEIEAVKAALARRLKWQTSTLTTYPLHLRRRQVRCEWLAHSAHAHSGRKLTTQRGVSACFAHAPARVRPNS